MKKNSIFFIIVLCAILITFLNSNAMSENYEDPGITDTEIKIGLFNALSGPYSSYGIDPMRFSKMWYEMINKRGGIHGRKLVFAEEDDKCSGTHLVAAVKKLITVDNVFLLHGGGCSSALLAAMDYVQRERVPLVGMTASMDGLIYPPKKYIFGGLGGTVHSFGGAVVDFCAKQLNTTKIAYVMHDDEYGSWGYESFEWQLKAEHKASPVSVEKISRDITDVTAVMLKIKNADPGAIVLMVYDRPGALLIREAHRLGVKCPIILGATGAINVKATADAVGNKDAFKNFYYQYASRDDYKDGPELQWARNLYEDRYPDLAKKPEFPSQIGFIGIASTKVVTLGLEMAGPHPTREKFIRALEGMGFLDTGVMAGYLHFSPDDHAGTESSTFYKFDGENLKKIHGNFESRWKYIGK
jgi:branched-chain amino acid transport system substrate-binding protein